MATTAEIQTLKDAHRRMWASGDYAVMAELVTDIGERIVDRAGVTAGSEVIDVAAGTGNAAIPAARTGAHVIAIDLTPELFTTGRSRAREEGVEVDWIAADAEDLPFEDERFDYVLSSLGVQFVPRHEVVARELVRVCRPGGTIVVGNWADDGFIGRIWRTMGPYMPAPPAYASPPAGWGNAEHVERLFAGYPVQLTFDSYSLDFRAQSAEAYIDMMADFYGPVLHARNKLSAEGRWEALRDELIGLGTDVNDGEDGTFRARSDYLVTLAHKRR